MPKLMCWITACPGLPDNQRFWDMVRIDAQPHRLSLDIDQESDALIRDLQKEGIIGKKAAAKSFRFEWTDDKVLRLVYLFSKKPIPLLQINLPADHQQELF